VTEDRDFKRRVRQRAAQTGQSYQAARRSLRDDAGEGLSGAKLHALAVKWLNQHWHSDRTCVVCGADDLAVGTDLIETHTTAGGTESPPPIYVPILCLTCGHTHLFDMFVVMGTPRGDQ
jgi:hypothetical protein